MFGHANSAPPSLQDVDPAVAQRFDQLIARAHGQGSRPSDTRRPETSARAAVAAAAGAAVTQPERSVASGAALGAADSLVTTQFVDHSGAWTRAESRTAAVEPAYRPASDAGGPSGAAVPAVPTGDPAGHRGRAGRGRRRRGDRRHPGRRVRGPDDREHRQRRRRWCEIRWCWRARTDEPRQNRRPPSPATPSTNLQDLHPRGGRLERGHPHRGGMVRAGGEPAHLGQALPDHYRRPQGTRRGDRLHARRGAAVRRRVHLPAGGSASPASARRPSTIFSGGDITQCQGSTCVDYIINNDQRGGGYGVLAGGGSDFGLAKQVGNRVMRTLEYNDY